MLNLSFDVRTCSKELKLFEVKNSCNKEKSNIKDIVWV